MGQVDGGVPTMAGGQKRAAKRCAAAVIRVIYAAALHGPSVSAVGMTRKERLLDGSVGDSGTAAGHYVGLEFCNVPLASAAALSS
jgi:hypothetical protein